MPPTSLTKRAAAAQAQFDIALAACLFVSAWSLAWWQGWVFWTVFVGGTAAATAYFLKHDPALIERRLKAGPGAESDRTQKLIQALAALLLFGMLVVPGLDHRFGWSDVPAWIAFAGDGLVALGFYLIFLTFRENSYAAGVIEIGSGQTVVATGPYEVVRHPMYSGALVMTLGIPLALGSLWGLLLWPPMVAVLAWRLVEEEKFLVRTLPAYADYCAYTRWRLVPPLY